MSMHRLSRVWRGVVTGVLLGLALTAVHAAPTPPREPQLLVEAGAHLAAINRITADASGRMLATASSDKTVRLWEAQTGRQLAVLRPPIGAGDLGALYAAAISPDGRTVAAGGNSSFDGSGHLLHLLDRVSGSVPPKSTLAGLPSPVTQLAWSRDGQLLAVALLQDGVHVFRRNLQAVGNDPEFNDAIYGLDFAADGRLAVVSRDGFVRMYLPSSGTMERAARKQLPGNAPYGVAFSPDGRLLAVGYQGGARVDVLDARTLDVVHTIQRNGGNLGRVAWSADGQTLYAGGNHASNGRFPVLAFDQGGRGVAREATAFSNAVMSLAALPDGAIAAASAEPSWQVVSRSGEVRASSRPKGADFRDSGAQFRVGATGEQVGFGLARGGTEPVFFDLAMGTLKSVPAPATAVAPALPAGLANWQNSTAPTYSGRKLNLREQETVRSAAALPRNQGFVLGSDWTLRQYGADGRQRWESALPAVAWAVNVSGDGKWVVAGLGDGTVRWYRASDGAEQLALFVHVDRSRWIVWTPGGYYDTSVGGEELVGWHLNRAFNQSADFFSAGRFRDKLYRPDVIQKVIALGDEQAAARAAQAEIAALEAANAGSAAVAFPKSPEPFPVAPAAPAPAAAPSPKVAAAPAPRQAPATVAPAHAPVPAPVAAPVAAPVRSTANVRAAPAADIVEIVPPIIELQSEADVEATGDETLIKYTVRTPPDAPIKEVKVRVNGAIERSIQPKATRGAAEPLATETKVRLPPGKDAEVVLVAENRNGKSDPITIKVKRPGAKAPVVGELPASKRPNLYMLVVAVSDYPQRPLVSPPKDASVFNGQFSRVAKPPTGTRRLYGDDFKTRMLVNEQATKENILAGLEWLQSSVTEKDVGILFLAGHGHNLKDKGGKISYQFLPYIPKDKNMMDTSGWLGGETIVKTLQSLKGRALFFLDTCHAGSLSNQAIQSTDNTSLINAVDDERGVTVFAASTSKQESGEGDDNGFFTQALIEGLRGKARDPDDDLIYPTTLKRYVTRRVLELSEGEQEPYILDRGKDQPLAVVIK